MNYKPNISITSMVPARRKSSTPIAARRDGGFPVNDRDDIYSIFEIEIELAKMRNMTAEEAAAHAAQVVSEAEKALAEAEEAKREADAAEADAQAAVAALLILRGRSSYEMRPWSRKAGG